jgi:glutamate carboxypeptidase
MKEKISMHPNTNSNITAQKIIFLIRERCGSITYSGKKSERVYQHGFPFGYNERRTFQSHPGDEPKGFNVLRLPEGLFADLFHDGQQGRLQDAAVCIGPQAHAVSLGRLAHAIIISVTIKTSHEFKMNLYKPYLDWISDQQDQMAETLIQWAEINSGTRNLAGLEDMSAVLERAFRPLAGEMKTIELQPQEIVEHDGRMIQMRLGRALSIEKRPSVAKRVFLEIHMDTVYSAGHPFQRCVRINERTLQGPGVADAKGGLLVMLKALEAFERSPWAENLGWEVLITPDEEIGSPGSAPLLAEAAANNHVGLVFEPAFPDGTLVGARKGSGNFSVVVRGRAAHAGRDPEFGRNAINALADFIVELNALAAGEKGMTINIANVRGGGPANVVPDLAFCRFNVRVLEPEHRQVFEHGLGGLAEKINSRDGISLEIHGSFARPPKPLDAKLLKLYDHVLQCGREIGLSLMWQPSGGACDGNNLVAAGLPTIDSLGVRGGNLHSSEEYVFLDSLPERAKLTALLLMKIAAGEVQIEG